MKVKPRIPVRYVKPLCIAAVLLGVYFTVSGNMIAGLCMLLGSFTLERSAYRCPTCGGRLTVKVPLTGTACCPQCHTKL
ncbi:MAG: hypothetical protein RSF82_05265 [Angelakisella sp.]